MSFARTFLVAFLLSGVSAHAEVVSERPDSIAVTFYHDDNLETSQLLHPEANSWVRDEGFAFITETRTIDLPAGPAVVKFRGVTSTMVPQTADVQGLPAGILERNFDYDLLSPGSLLAKSIGETVHLVRTDPKTGKLSEQDAIVRSGPNGAIFEINGKFEALRCSGLPEKLVFDHLPGGLADTPTLSVRTMAPTAGHYVLKLSYIATGLNWSADYVARIQPGTGKLALSGWLTLANFSTTSFLNAPVDVVAGKLQTTGDDTPVKATPPVLAENCWPTNIDWATHHLLPPPPAPPPPMLADIVTASPQQEMKFEGTTEAVIIARQLGDYKLYPLPEPTNVAAQQTKQIQFLDQRDVTFERIYRFTLNAAGGADRAAIPDVLLRLQNRADDGLGKSLPAGNVSVFEPGPDSGLVFAGQNSIGDTSVGLPLEVEMGRAMDVRVVPHLLTSTASGKAGDKQFRDAWEVTLENDKAVPIRFEFRQGLYDGRGIIASESPAHRTQYGYAIWDLKLAPGERQVVHYVVTHP